MRIPIVAGLFALVFVGVLAARGGADSQKVPDAVSADPDHYSVEFENDAVRILRIRYGAGEASVMHHHPANCAVFLTEAKTKFELANGETVDAPTSAGQVLCGDEDVHLPSNVGDTSLELVLVELKGRKTFSE